MYLHLIDDEIDKKEFFKVALFTMLSDDFNRSLDDDEEVILKRVFSELLLYEDDNDFDDLLEEVTEELDDVSTKVGEVVSDDDKLFTKIVTQNVIKGYLTTFRELANNVQSSIIFELLLILNLAGETSGNLVIEALKEAINLNDESFSAIEKSVSGIKSSIADMQRIIG